MNTQEVIDILEGKGVKPTANRIIVLKTLHDAHYPMSLKTLEEKLLSMDKSSIFRVLSIFLEHDVVHSFEDGRGLMNYELCVHRGPCHHDENHIHFYCESCQRSYCIKDIHIPEVELPDGFLVNSVSFVVKGLCPKCRERRKSQTIHAI